MAYLISQQSGSGWECPLLELPFFYLDTRSYESASHCVLNACQRAFICRILIVFINMLLWTNVFPFMERHLETSVYVHRYGSLFWSTRCVHVCVRACARQLWVMLSLLCPFVIELLYSFVCLYLTNTPLLSLVCINHDNTSFYYGVMQYSCMILKCLRSLFLVAMDLLSDAFTQGFWFCYAVMCCVYEDALKDE